MEKKTSNTVAALLRKSVGLPPKGSTCCGGGDEIEPSPSGNSAAENASADTSVAGACCGVKQNNPDHQ